MQKVSAAHSSTLLSTSVTNKYSLTSAVWDLSEHAHGTAFLQGIDTTNSVSKTDAPLRKEYAHIQTAEQDQCDSVGY